MYRCYQFNVFHFLMPKIYTIRYTTRYTTRYNTILMARSYMDEGTPGNMPYDEYLRKIATSNVEEDPDAIENYMRKGLADFRPDPPSLAAHQPRSNDTISRDVLSLRYNGARAGEDPYLEEGSFTDHEFLERDPRGTTNMPDFLKVRPHNQTRGMRANFQNDDDYSVPESGVAPARMVDNLRGGQADIARRFTNFEESQGNWSNGVGLQQRTGADIKLVTGSGVTLNITDAESRSSDYVTRLSNKLSSEHRHTTPDHRVLIGRYDVNRPAPDLRVKDYRPENTSASQAVVDPIDGHLQRFAAAVHDAEAARAAQTAASGGAQYEESVRAQTRKAQRVKEAGAELVRAHVIGSSAMQEYGALGANRLLGPQIATQSRATSMNHEIAAAMIAANRTPLSQRQHDLRDSIAQSAADNGLYHVAMQRSRVESFDPTARNSVQGHHAVDTTLATKNYSMARGVPVGTNTGIVDFDMGVGTSEAQKVRGRVMKYGSLQGNVQQDVNMSEFATAKRRQGMAASRNRGDELLDYGDIAKREELQVFRSNNSVANAMLRVNPRAL